MHTLTNAAIILLSTLLLHNLPSTTALPSPLSATPVVPPSISTIPVAQQGHETRLSTLVTSQSASSGYDTPIQLVPKKPTLSANNTYPLAFTVSDSIHSQSFQATCKGSHPVSANNPGSSGADSEPPNPVGALQPCDPPTWQWQIVSWTSPTNWTLQVQHSIRVMMQEPEVYIRKTGHEKVDCAFVDEKCWSHVYTFGDVTHVDAPDTNWLGDEIM